MREFWRWPEDISTFGAQIDSMFHNIAWLLLVVFILVEALIVSFLIRYRHREGRKAHYVHGNMNMEIAWTVATALIMVVVGVASRGLWLDIKDARRFPPAGLELIITAKQFEWNVTYPGADNKLNTPDDFVRRNQLHVPVNVPVHVALRSEDVIHSFFLPELRLKQDAVPGMDIPAWFQATRAGSFSIGCAELCGLGHYKMKGSLTVHTADEWTSWTTQQQTAAAGGQAAPPVAAAAVHSH
ncbi:MAG: cytochrome c oxidase subunit II [Gemmatimonadota bacterium]